MYKIVRIFLLFFQPWENTGNLNQKRAFASSITYEIEFNNTILYFLGGYQKGAGFLNSVERYDKNAETFELVTSMEMPEKKSHFCTLLVKVGLLSTLVEPSLKVMTFTNATSIFLTFFFTYINKVFKTLIEMSSVRKT